MRVFSRFIIPSLIVLSFLAFATVPVVQHLTERWFERDLDLRSKVILSSVQAATVPLITTQAPSAKIAAVLDRVAANDRLIGMAICTAEEVILAKSRNYPNSLRCAADPDVTKRTKKLTIDGKDVHMVTSLLYTDMGTATDLAPVGSIILLQDRSFIAARAKVTRNYLLFAFAMIGAIVLLLSLAAAQWSQHQLVGRVRKLMRTVLHRKDFSRVEDDQFKPIMKDLRKFMKDFQESSQSMDDLRTTWGAKTIKEILSKELLGDEIIVVSNRQPYAHIQRGESVEVQSPASGLVTAVEPIVKACSGVWIAHGSGNVDRHFVDKKDMVAVPPEKPEYKLHRIWLTKEEEKHYYYGFSNEGLWPLCHIAYTRPIFRREDWDTYVEVNRKFAEAVIRDAKHDDPVVLVHDYHFALVPKFLREKLPKATVITFWHIPWPNAESFGICPWQKEILEGLLGSSILGFHTQFHCNNFIECVDRVLESRIDRETNSITYQGNVSAIKPYPISIEWPPNRLKDVPDEATCRSRVQKEFDLAPDVKIAVGVDRLDYTKGIVERFRAIERTLEISPSLRGHLSLIQIAAPSRTSIAAYKNFHDDVVATAARINERFGDHKGHQPIKLVAEHREPVKVLEYLRAADVCMVTSLHDGMNLVAKEFIAARDDEQGALILSVFTGASRELIEALMVNPYDIEQTAHALLKALTMPQDEQRDRMRLLRSVVKEYNVFRWAGRMLLDAAVLRKRQRLGQHGGAEVIQRAPSNVRTGRSRSAAFLTGKKAAYER